MGSAVRQVSAASEDPGTFTTSTNRWWAAFTVAFVPLSLLRDDKSRDTTVLRLWTLWRLRYERS